MSKISQYLNEHILGDVTTDAAVRKQLSTDASLLAMTPEIVVYPRVTNDIRKVLRFTYQLALKGHSISVTARGAGSDQTGAAIGEGIVVNFTGYMQNIFEFESKQRLVRVQPGATFGALNSALKLQGYSVPTYPRSQSYSTIGGAVANNSSGRLSGRYGAIEEYVAELEVVLANGDVIQTSRLSKRELSKKKGLQTFEGEIYRAIDTLLTDSEDLIDTRIDVDGINNVGYANISKVREKNGSFDLTPLFIGSQGTLGIISEMILKAEFYNSEEAIVAIAVAQRPDFHDIIDELRALNPDYLEVIDGELVELARKQGKRYPLIEQALSDDVTSLAGLIICSFADFNERARKKKLKKINKLVTKYEVTTEEAVTPERLAEVSSLLGITYGALQSEGHDRTASPLFTGVYIPQDRFEEFRDAVSILAKTNHIAMPFSGHANDSVYSFWPQLSMRTVTDKQRLLKLYDAFVKVVDAHSGSVVAEGGEGRLKTPFAQQYVNREVVELYATIRKIFDPYNTLNSGVKQSTELRTVVAHLRAGYDGADFAAFSAE